MGIPFVAVKMPKCFGLKFLLEFLTFIKLLLLFTLSNLRMFKPPQQQPYSSDQDQETAEDYVLVMDELCPSPIPVPVSILTRLIKKKLPVITYSCFLERSGKLEDDKESMCLVCLDCLQGRDEVRELCNCSHVFHLNCLDSWVGHGQVTCPTCRSMLFPKKMGASAMSIFGYDDSAMDEQVNSITHHMNWHESPKSALQTPALLKLPIVPTKYRQRESVSDKKLYNASERSSHGYKIEFSAASLLQQK
ncbi:unnamed protein product [Dovyalis caffra]|uniref:RING-type domain-containing protein n=1 Tax=Dovyalis caffra TaxID=77055 RepID=A0AAV1SUQ5_9ROSI|nr:unnamed protein product [Dovyalis caffra]